jgi:DNA-binding HxlR family transcriptional regulator
MPCDADTSDADCLAEWCAGEDWCAVTCAMDAIGNKWQPVVVATLSEAGPLRFNDLAAAIPPVTNKTLSASLDDMTETGLVDRDVVAEKPVAVEYSLTERGRALEPVIGALREWGEQFGRQPDEPTPAIEVT